MSSSPVKKLQTILKTRGAGNVVSRLWSQVDEDKDKKFLRSLQHVPEETVYKVSLDLWLSVERYGEAAVRVALETMLDRDCRNLLLNNDWSVLDRGDRFAQVVANKKTQCKNYYLGNKGAESLDLNNDWKLKYEELERQYAELEEKKKNLETAKGKLQEELWKFSAAEEERMDTKREEGKGMSVRIEDLEQELAKMKDQATLGDQQLVEERDRLQAQNAELRDGLDSYEAKLAALTAEVSNKAKLLERYEEEVGSLDDILNGVSKLGTMVGTRKGSTGGGGGVVDEEELQRRIAEALKEKEQSMKRQLQENGAEVAQVTAQLMDSIKSLEKRMLELEKENADLRDAKEKLEQKIEATGADEEKSRRRQSLELRGKDAKILELTQTNHELETSLAELRIRLQALAKKIQDADGAGVDNLKTVLDDSGLSSFLFDENRSGKSIRKIHERLYQDFFNRAVRLQKLIQEAHAMRERVFFLDEQAVLGLLRGSTTNSPGGIKGGSLACSPGREEGDRSVVSERKRLPPTVGGMLVHKDKHMWLNHRDNTSSGAAAGNTTTGSNLPSPLNAVAVNGGAAPAAPGAVAALNELDALRNSNAESLQHGRERKEKYLSAVQRNRSPGIDLVTPVTLELDEREHPDKILVKQELSASKAAALKDAITSGGQKMHQSGKVQLRNGHVYEDDDSALYDGLHMARGAHGRGRSPTSFAAKKNANDFSVSVTSNVSSSSSASKQVERQRLTDLVQHADEERQQVKN
eukprot:g19490.t1